MMKGSASTVLEMISRLRPYFQKDRIIRSQDVEAPLRSELYNYDQMNRHGLLLAKSHEILIKPSSDKLLKRLDEIEKILLEVRNLLVENIVSGKTITPGGEWLLDNFYLIEEQVLIAKKHLPKKYSENLPYLASGNSANMPRVYDIVLEIISHSDGRVGAKGLTSFVAAYQKHTILTLGELWAIPIMLRLAVLENLCRVSTGIAVDLIDDNLSGYWSEKMISTQNSEPADLILTIADMAREKPVLESAFVAGFAKRLQGKGPGLALPLNWLEQQLSRAGTSCNDLVLEDNQRQAANQVTIRNSIGTLRFLGATDWKEFVETLSKVNQVLKNDPARIYARMDFATRDRYRHVIEKIAKSSPLSETEVAQKIVDLAKTGSSPDEKFGKKRHVGYYLIDEGLPEAEAYVNMTLSFKQKVFKAAHQFPVFLYLFSISLITIGFAAGMWLVAYRFGNLDWWILALVGILSISGASQLGVSFVNWLSTILVKPNLLPRMDFSKGVPTECRTLVVIPTMLGSRAYIDELVAVSYTHLTLPTICSV